MNIMTNRINMKSWRDKIISSKKSSVMLIMTHPGIELIGQNVEQAVTSGNVHADAIIKLADTFDNIALTMIMDLSLEAEAFGAKINFATNEVPSVIEPLLKDFTDIDNLEIPNLTNGRIPEYIKANAIVLEHLQQSKPLFSSCIGPYSLACRLFGMTELMMAQFTDPVKVHTLIAKCTTFIIKYCKALKDLGSNGVIIAEPVAGLLSPEDCDNFSSRYVQRIVSELQDDYFMIILHNCGTDGKCCNAMYNTGADGYHFGNMADMEYVLASSPANVMILGNIDPVGVLKCGTIQQVKNELDNLKELTEKYKNFVISSGCDIAPNTPLQNIGVVYDYMN